MSLHDKGPPMAPINAQTSSEELVDTLLAEWPTPARSALEWDTFAEQIMAKVGTDTPRVEDVLSDAKFLLAPTLEGAMNSGSEATASHPVAQPHLEERMGAISQRDRRSSLQDLAKLAAEGGPLSQRAADSFAAPPMSQRGSERSFEGSGVVDLQSLTALPSSPSAVDVMMPANVGTGAKSDTFAVATKADDSAPVVAAVSAPADSEPSSIQESIPPMPVSITAAATTQETSGSNPRVGVLVGGVVGVLAVAAGALFFVMSKQPAPETSAAASTVAVTAPAEEKAAIAPANPVAETTTAAPTEAAGGLDPAALPTKGTEGATASNHATHSDKSAASTTHAATSDKAIAAVTPKATKESAAKEKKAAEPPPPSGIPDNDLGKAMKQASTGGVVGSGVSDDKAAPQYAAGTVPQKPSQGTLTSALGRVLGKAKSCIGPDDPISRASVVFASAGNVQSVNVSGHAAGKPAEACIKSAISQAKLNTPFAEPTYTTTVTIRP